MKTKINKYSKFSKLLLNFVALSLISCFLITGLALPTEKAYAATIGTNTFTAGWATFGQVVPQGLATSGLQVGSFLTQTDVKNRWPDGSIRFAVVTANITTAGNYSITSTTASSGSFPPTVPNASVQFNISGTTYIANLPNSPSSDLWLDGPLVKEWRREFGRFAIYFVPEILNFTDQLPSAHV